jgi:pectinesterase
MIRRSCYNGLFVVLAASGFLLLFDLQLANAQSKALIIVDKNGKGDYCTLSEAIAALPMFNYQRITIFIRNGIYEEKVRLEQDYVTLKGEDRDRTIIHDCQLREDWIQNKDSIGPAVINIHADDIILENLTIKNTQPEIGPHAFAIYGTGTRTIVKSCKVISKGGDTVALWDYKTGMYYHADCYFEGAVDFVCPRGWCYIKNSEFFEVKKSAALWHAGGFDPDQKFVLANCRFDGIKDFQLGRHHYEAQFFLLNCRFGANLADQPIYRVVYADSTRNRPFNWGERTYFYNCHRTGDDYDWFKDNLATAPNSPPPEQITARWTFAGQWDPETKTGPVINNVKINGNEILLTFNEIISVTGKPVLRSKSGKILYYDSGAGSPCLRFRSDTQMEQSELVGLMVTNEAKIIGTIAAVYERPADLTLNF